MSQPQPPLQTPEKNTTVSPEELAKFSAMAESWWDPNGAFKPLHKFNPLRIDFIRTTALAHFNRDTTTESPFNGLKALDIGCGGGLLCEPLARLGFSTTGIDALERNIGTAHAHASQNGLTIDYRYMTTEDLAAEGALFDMVLAMEVVEHVADRDLFLKTAATLVRPGGLLIGATINRTLNALVTAKFGAEYILRWLPRGTHDWNKFVKPSEFAAGLEAGGVIIKTIKGMSYAPFRDAWDLTDDLSINYILSGTKTA